MKISLVLILSMVLFTGQSKHINRDVNKVLSASLNTITTTQTPSTTANIFVSGRSKISKFFDTVKSKFSYWNVTTTARPTTERKVISLSRARRVENKKLDQPFEAFLAENFGDLKLNNEQIDQMKSLMNQIDDIKLVKSMTDFLESGSSSDPLKAKNELNNLVGSFMDSSFLTGLFKNKKNTVKAPKPELKSDETMDSLMESLESFQVFVKSLTKLNLKEVIKTFGQVQNLKKAKTSEKKKSSSMKSSLMNSKMLQSVSNMMQSMHKKIAVLKSMNQLMIDFGTVLKLISGAGSATALKMSPLQNKNLLKSTNLLQDMDTNANTTSDSNTTISAVDTNQEETSSPTVVTNQEDTTSPTVVTIEGTKGVSKIIKSIIVHGGFGGQIRGKAGGEAYGGKGGDVEIIFH